jgi:hypothetical protein
MLNRRGGWGAIVAPLVVGLIGFFTLMQRPRFADIHTVDVVQLLASGMCFGVALTALVFWLRNRTADKNP